MDSKTKGKAEESKNTQSASLARKDACVVGCTIFSDQFYVVWSGNHKQTVAEKPQPGTRRSKRFAATTLTMGPTKITPEDQAFNISFVGEVKKHPCLFDSGNPDYKQQVLQDRAWLEVSNAVGESAETCKKRWRNLRCCMTRYQKSVRDSNDQSANSRRKPYYLYNHMQFVLPHLKAREESNVYEPDEPSWAKAESESIGESKHEDEDEEMEPHEIETIEVPEEDHSEHIKDSILNSIKIVPISQEQQTVSGQEQQPDALDANDTSTASQTAYEIIAAPPLKQSRLSNTHTSVGSISPVAVSPLQTSGTDAKRDILAQRQFFTLSAPIQSANIPISCYTTTPLSSQALHQQQPQQQQPTITHPQMQTQVPPHFTIIPNTPTMANDADHNFFQSLIPDIQTMTMEQKRKLKIGILQLIDTILNN
uniref:MADF domain-containing protein n=1 Tax=Anopheles culicifacies TaxID=139723 RepID=A0A182LZV2_9DIPT